MQLTPEYIELLAEKRLSGTISREELVLLEQWLNKKVEEPVIWDSQDMDEEALRKRLLERIKMDAGLSPSVEKTVRASVRHQWAVAATILVLVIGSLSYLFFSRKDIQEDPSISVAESPVPDVAPGQKGAILTLSNGQKIVLDSLGNGTIAVQGSRSLVKQNGTVVYGKKDATITEKEKNKEELLYNTITTPRGREFQITLADGSSVWLNAASSITFPTAFTGRDRRVTVTGEAYFEVARNEMQPFIVSAGGAEVQVLGTHFDVMAYPDDGKVRTTLVEGSVRVNKGDQQVIIKPGEQADLSSASNHIQVAKVDAEQAVAWINGKLALNNLDVEEIMKNLSRWYDVDVEFDGPVSQDRFWGLINREVSLQDMLRVLRANGINAVLKDKKIIVSSL